MFNQKALFTLFIQMTAFTLFSATFTVDNLDDSGPGSFRQAIIDANDTAGRDTINVTVTGTLNFTTATSLGFNLLPNIADVVINGNGLIVSNANAISGRFAQVSDTDMFNISFTSSNGPTTSGALFLRGNNSFTNCDFSNNMLQAASGGIGGAVRVQSGTSTFTDCTFTGNRAGEGAAIWVQNAVCNLINTSISSSEVVLVDPRSEFESAVSVRGGVLNMTNSTISGTTPSDAPDIYVTDGGLGVIDANSNFGNCSGPGCPSTEPDCAAVGGTLVIEGTTSSETSVCTGDSVADVTVGELTGNTGSRSFFMTNADGIIRGFLGSNNNFNVENFSNDVVYIRNIAMEGTVTGLGIGQDIADLEGCFNLSNPIIITTSRVGTACDDGNPCTTGDVHDASCNCTGTLQDADGDGVCDDDDVCAGHDDNIDTDGDGIPDGCEEPECGAVGGTLVIEGTTSSETSVCTGDNVADVTVGELTGNTGSRSFFMADANGIIRGFLGSNNNFNVENFGNDVVYIRNIAMEGTVTGLGIGQDIADLEGCFNLSDPLIITTTRVGTACDDGDPCTTGDTLDATCNCTGAIQDSDGDGVCDTQDVCPGSDDNIDSDNDGIPDGCDGPVVAPTGVPTMGEWLLISLALIIMILATVAMRMYVFKSETTEG